MMAYTADLYHRFRQEDDVLSFRMKAIIGCLDDYTVVSSCVKKIYVTNFPIGPDPERDITICALDSDGYPVAASESFVCEEVVVKFVEGTDSDTIKEIVNTVGGIISEAYFEYEPYYIVKLDSCDCPAGVNNAIAILQVC